MAEIPKEMLRAQTNVILLNVLKQGDNYVYGIIKQVKEASNGEMELNEATLYTIFKTVSYTHLDVYKRQLLMNQKQKQPSICQ